MRTRLIPKVILASLLAALWTGCQTGQQHAPSIGEAYVGPAALNLRSDIPLESKVVATVKHGDRLQLLQRRRKFLRVRAPNGAEGWTDERQLLAASDMDALQALSARAAKMPNQGVAVAYGDLRVYTAPSVHSPAFVVIKKGEKFDVLSHQVVPRVDLPRPPLIPPAPKKPKAPPKKKESRGKYPPPPMPKPPPPPADWLDLSKTDLSKEEPEPEPEPGPKAIPSDNWSLVRASGGQSGWVLTRRLTMAIPDEVAQYAEGHRIVSYFSLGSVQDDGEQKKTWLWTTIGGSGQPYDFDSLRIFVWSLRHHRYETAHVMHNLEGYEPVLIHEVELGHGIRGVAAGRYPGFSVCLATDDGQKVRQDYAYLGNAVRLAGEGACELPPPIVPSQLSPAMPHGVVAPAPPPEPQSLWQRLKKRLHGSSSH